MAKVTSSGPFDGRWDNGGGLFDAAREADGFIDAVEIADGGGAASFARDVRALPAADQRQALLAVRGPEARAMLEQGLAPGLTTADARLAGEARRFAVETLGLTFAETARGVEAAHVARLPLRAIPISSAEYRIELLRERLSGRPPMTMVELGQVFAQHPGQAPPVAASALVRAIAMEPQRYDGARLLVTGLAEEISRHASTGAVHSPHFDVATGQLRNGLRDTSILETYHRFFSPGEREAHLVLYNRVEDASFATMGARALGSAHGGISDGRYSVRGVVRVRADRPPLLIVN